VELKTGEERALGRRETTPGTENSVLDHIQEIATFAYLHRFEVSVT